MRVRDFRRGIVLAASLVAFASCDALVGISNTSVAQGGTGGTGGVDASAGAAGSDASSGTGGSLDASFEADADGGVDTGTDTIVDAPSDQNVSPSHGLTCALWPGDSPVSLGCPTGQVITGFSTALYGTPIGSCSGGEAGNGGFKPGACNAPDVQQALGTLCDGLTSCTFTPNANLDAFAGEAGDPCPGTSKFIAAQVECGPAPPPVSADAGSTTLSIGQILDLDGNRFTSAAVSSAVDTWNDDSPNPNPLNANVPNSVSPATVGHDQTSGLGLVQLSGSQYFTLPSIISNLSHGLTVFAVIAPGNLRTWQPVFDFGNGSAQDNVVLAEQGLSRSLAFEVYQGSTEYTDASPDTYDTSELQLFAVREAQVGSMGSLLKTVTYKGGVPVYEQFMPAPNNVTRSNDLVGMSNRSGAELYQGYMGQLVVYDRALTDAEMAAFTQILMSRWKLCASTDTSSDPTNCGYCGHLCAPGQQCQDGVCTGSLVSNCLPVAAGSGSYDYALCRGRGGNAVSWVQASNACGDLGGNLMSISDQTGSNAVAGAAGSPVRVGLTDFGTGHYYWTDGSSTSFNAWPSDGGTPSTAQEQCAEVKSVPGGSIWQAISCTAPQTDPWLCKVPQPTPSCDTWLDPTTQRAYAICDGAFPTDQMRRDVCATQHGTLLAVQGQTEATNLGLLLRRIGGNLASSAIDLTDGATPLDWTLEDGNAAPFVDWLPGEPQVGNEPRCAMLSVDGQMASTPCNGTAEPVICSLPNDTQPDETVGTVPPNVQISFQKDTVTASVTFSNGQNTDTFKHDDTISANVDVVCGSTVADPPPVTAELSFSPGFGVWKVCLPASTFPCSPGSATDSGTGTDTTKTVQLQVPPIAGVFDLAIQFATGDNCAGPVGNPETFGRIAVTAQ